MSKPILTYQSGKILGLAGTQDGDVLTWSANVQEWISAQPGGGGGGGGTGNTSLSFNSRTFVVGDSSESGQVSITGTAPYPTGVGTYTFNLVDAAGTNVASYFNALSASVALENTYTYASINNVSSATSSATVQVLSVTINSTTATVTFDTPLFAAGTLPNSVAIVFSWTFAIGRGTVSSVTVDGGTTGLTFSDGTITTSGTATLGGTLGVASGGTGTDLSGTSGFLAVSNGVVGRVEAISLTSDVTGTLPLSQGGTGADLSDITSGQVIVGDSTNGTVSARSISGDITLTYDGSVSVTKLRGNSLPSTGPTEGQTLVYTNNSWSYVTYGGPTGSAGGIIGYTNSTYPNPSGLAGNTNNIIPLLGVAGTNSPLRFQVDDSADTLSSSLSIAGGSVTSADAEESGGSITLQGGNGPSGGNITLNAGTASNQLGSHGTVDISGKIQLNVSNGHLINIGNSSTGGSVNVYTSSSNSINFTGATNINTSGSSVTSIGNATGGILTPLTASRFVKTGTDSKLSVSSASTIDLTSEVSNTLAILHGGTNISALSAGDAGKVLAVASGGGSYELKLVGTVTSVTAGEGLNGGTFTDSGTISLPNVGSAVTDLGSATASIKISTDAKGRITSATSQSIQIAQSQVDSLPDSLSGKALKATNIHAGEGLSGGGDLSADRTISMPNVGTAQTDLGSASSTLKISTDVKGRVTAASAETIAITQSQVTGLSDALTAKVPNTLTITTTTGQLTGGGTLSSNLTLGLATLGTSGDYGSASVIPVLTLDGYGRVSAVNATSIAIATSQVSGLDTELSGKALKTTQLLSGTGISITGGSLSGDNTIALASGVVTPETKGTASKSAAITVDTYGRVTSLSDNDISIAASQISSGGLSITRGGTGSEISSITAGQLLIASASNTFINKTISGDIGTITAEGAITVTGLQGKPVAGTAPTMGQVLQWNGTNWVPGAVASGGSGGGGVLYYFDFGTTTGIAGHTTNLPTNNNSTPIAAPSLLGRSHNFTTAQVTSQALTKDTLVPIAGFVTEHSPDIDPGILRIPAGLWDFNFWCNAPDSSSTNQTGIKAVVYKYNGTDAPGTGGSTLIAESDIVYLYDLGTTSQYTLNVTVPETTTLATDRIYIELQGIKSVNQTRVLNFFFDSTRPSHVHTTIPSVSGTGIVHVVDGVYQSPATAVGLATSDVTGTLPIANGGTGTTSLTSNGILLGNGTNAITATSALTNGQLLIGSTNNSPSPATLTAGTGVSITNGSGTISIATSQDVGTGGSPSFNGLTVSGLTDGFVKSTSGVLSGGHTIDISAITTGTLAVGNGGTGLATLTAGSLYLGNGTTALEALTGSTAGDYVKWDAGNTKWVRASLASDAVTSISVTSGHISTSGSAGGVTLSLPSVGTAATGQGTSAKTVTISTDGQGRVTSLTENDISITSSAISDLGSNTVTSLAGTTNQVSVSGSNGAVTLSLPQDISNTSSVSFASLSLTTALDVGSGGTGANSHTNHAILIGKSTSAIGSVLLAAGQILIGTASDDPTPATITGSGGVTVTSTSGAISISTGQDVATTNDVTFKSATLNDLTVSQYVKSDANKKLVSVASIPATDVTGIPYDLAGRVVGNPATSDILFDLVAERTINVNTTVLNTHSFYVKTLGTNAVTLYVKKYSSSTSSTILTITYPAASGATASANGYFQASTIVLTEGATGVISRGDRITVEIGTTDALFNTPLFTVNASI
jgi:hypothetical protein